MEIKPGDIVEYRGKRVRVMTMIHDEPDVRLKLSYFGWCETISLDDVKLIESVPKPTIKDYDDIIIQPIPNIRFRKEKLWSWLGSRYGWIRVLKHCS